MTIRLALAAALTMLAAAGGHTPAAAQRAPEVPASFTDTVVRSCVHHRGSGHCVQQFRYGDRGNTGVLKLQEPTEQDVAELRERERRWVARCRPLLRTDAYGVNRYVYAARGCEYGQDRD
jgi:Spy/CpxP family protein refolding chaperone